MRSTPATLVITTHHTTTPPTHRHLPATNHGTPRTLCSRKTPNAWISAAVAGLGDEEEEGGGILSFMTKSSPPSSSAVRFDRAAEIQHPAFAGASRR
ncbi:hypothetical protein Tdes44962_MAKER05305 [Teratosphaeria destructans]|uniref:Uncharacterized protein n=1 Tax=Teratosphaeria destructans TaxID=418781 RepID=A0A9W7SK28_9PEZI|nr:hypothetical protein Tdes44962_MAKER05305 [Teratosphaeria destructans]